MGEKKAIRTRNYATVVYPESAPDDWMNILSGHRIPAFISPLHDSDVNPTGEKKKEHFHVMLCYEGPKTKKQAMEVFESIGGVGCEVVNSIRGYARYLCHLDNPEKTQYDVEQVKCLCGSDYNATIGLPTDKYKCVKEMIYWCCENDVLSYSDLLEYAIENRFDWFRVLCDSCSFVMKEYLKSKAWKLNFESDQEGYGSRT